MLLDIGKKTLAASNHFKQSLARGKVLLIGFEMTTKTIDPFGEERNLDFRRSSVGFVNLIIVEDFLLLGLGQSHEFLSWEFLF